MLYEITYDQYLGLHPVYNADLRRFFGIMMNNVNKVFTLKEIKNHTSLERLMHNSYIIKQNDNYIINPNQYEIIDSKIISKMYTPVIYKTICLKNNKIYVGMNKNNDPSYYGSGTYLKKDLDKYGHNYFIKESLEYTSLENLREREKFWIYTLKATDKKIGYNRVCGYKLEKELSNV